MILNAEILDFEMKNWSSFAYNYAEIHQRFLSIYNMYKIKI
jgi:hypothetical protein